MDTSSAEGKKIARIDPLYRAIITLLAASMMLAPASFSVETATPGVADLMRHTMAANQKNREALRSYVWQEDSVALEGGQRHTQKFEWTIVGGVRVRKQIESDGKLLTGSDARREEQRIAKAVERRKRFSADEVRKREEEERRTNDEIQRAFEFRVVREETVNGRPAWVVTAAPRPGYHPVSIPMEFISRLHGTLWIDEQEYQWARVEAGVDESVAAAWGMAKLEKGSHFSLESVRLADGVWVPQRTEVKGSARIALIKRMPLDMHSTSSQFRKVSGDAPVMELRE